MSGCVTNVGIKVASDAMTAIEPGTLSRASPCPSRYATTLSINVIARSEWPLAKLVHWTTEPGVSSTCTETPFSANRPRSCPTQIGQLNAPGKTTSLMGACFSELPYFSAILLKKCMDRALCCQLRTGMVDNRGTPKVGFASGV